MSDILILFQMVAAVICLNVIVILCFKKQCAERGTLLLIMTAVFFYNLAGTLMGTLERNYIHKVSDIIYMIAEICFYLGMWKIVSCTINRPWTGRLLRMLAVYFSVLLGARLTNQWHVLFYKKVNIAESSGRIYMCTEPAVLSYVYTASILAGTLAMFLLFLTVCIRGLGKVSRNEGKKYGMMLLATAIPCLSYIEYFMDSRNFCSVKAFSMFAEGILIVFAMNRYHLLPVVERARELVIDTMDIGLVIVDRECSYLDSNTYAAQIFQELLYLEKGKNILTETPEMRVCFQEKAEGELVKNGKYYAWKRSEVYLDGHQRGYAVCLYDITQQKAVMRRLLQMKQRAEAENEQKGVFLANASHEIRTPMNVILGMSEVCMQKTENPEIRNMLRVMKEAGEGLLEIINGILDFSKIEAGKAEIQEDIFSLEEVLLDFFGMMKGRLYQSQVKFRVRIGEHVPRFLRGDGGKVQTVLMNLLSNARKYTGEGEISLGVESLEENKEQWILFEVRDTGIGMTQQDVELIFEKYTQVGDGVEAHRGGTGLGLSITRSMVEIMKGSIQVETALGEGSVFRVKLPLARVGTENISYREITEEQLEQYRERRKEKEEISVIYPGARILVVDDMDVNLKVAQGMLELYQIESQGVLSGEEALELLESEAYDILFIDQMMPQMSGVETLQKIREAGVQTPAVALTAQNIQEEIRYLKENGFSDVLVKPLVRKKMEEVLKRYMKGKQQKGSVQSSRNQQDILKSYYYQVSEIAKNLSKEYSEDFETFLIQVHGIKGASRNIGAALTASLAEQLEQEGKEGNLDYVRTHIEEFQKVLERTLQWVRKKIEDDRAEGPRKEKIEREALEYIKDRLEEFELEEAQKKLEEIMQYSYPPKTEEMLFYLEYMMVNLEYKEAAKAVCEILAQEGTDR